jgi:hypothetical protein
MAGKSKPAVGARAHATDVDELSAATKALADAAQALATSAAGLAKAVHEPQTSGPGEATSPTERASMNEPTKPEQPNAAEKSHTSQQSAPQDVERQRFYERLEQAGQLVDVAEDTDLSTLPPHVTHIRRPDGSVKRIGFSSSYAP